MDNIYHFYGLDHPDHVIDHGPFEVAVVKEALYISGGEMYGPFKKKSAQFDHSMTARTLPIKSIKFCIFSASTTLTTSSITALLRLL